MIPRSNPNGGRPKEGKDCLDVLAVIFSGCAFLAAVAAAVFTGYQASIAHDTEKRQLRAYVGMSAVSIEAVAMLNGEIMWNVEAIWRNSGVTPARHLITYANSTARLKGGSSVGVAGAFPMTLGPKDEMPTEGGSASSSNMSDFIVRGVAIYKDAFGHDRVTAACRQAEGAGRDFSSAKIGDVIRLQSVSCGEGNCADEDCEPYDGQIKKMVEPQLPTTPKPTIPAAAYKP